MCMGVALLILGSLLLSTFVFAGHTYFEYRQIKNRTARFRLEDALLIVFICFVPIANLLMLLSLLFRAWQSFDLNTKITNMIRGEGD